MSIEKWFLKSEEEKKLQKFKEKQEKYEKSKKLEQERIKQENIEKKENFNILKRLEEMLEDWKLSQNEIQELKQLVNNIDISENEVEEILNKIEELEEIEDIDNYLPKKFRINTEEYKKSLTNSEIRKKTLKKISSALNILSEQINSDSGIWMNLFSWYMIILDKNLIKIQENNIDIKNSLENINKK